MPENILITGGMRGIGYHITDALLEKGYRVCVLDIATDKLDYLREKGGENFQFFKCDITDFSEMNFFVEKIAHQWKSIDILINNACKAIYKDFEYRREEELKEEMEINYFGTVNLIRAVFPFMKRKGAGIIHNVSSGISICGFNRMSGYTSSKGAIEALTKTLSIEFKKYGITVNIIHPPLTRTKSSSALGIPVEMMDNPEKVGRRIAEKVKSKKRYIFTDFKSAFFTKLMYLFPNFFGRFFSGMTEKYNLKK